MLERGKQQYREVCDILHPRQRRQPRRIGLHVQQQVDDLGLPRGVQTVLSGLVSIDDLLDALERSERKPDASFDLGRGVTARFEVDRLIVDSRASLGAEGEE